MINTTCNATLDDMRIGDSEAALVGSMTFHTLALIVAAACSLIAVLFSFYLIFMHAIHYTKPNEQQHIIRILFMIPVYAVASFLSVWFYWHSIYFSVISDCYEAFAIASFFALLCHYIAPTLHDQKAYFRGIQPLGWVLPLSWFKNCCGGERGPWRTPRSGLTWFNIIWSGVYQYCFIRVAMTISAVVAQYLGRYCQSSNSPVFAHIWILVIEGVAVTIAMFCLIQFYYQLRHDLAPHSPFMKILAIKLVIFLSFWQSFLLSFLTSPSFNIITPTAHIAYPDLVEGIPALLVCIEMAIFSVLHQFAFPWQPYSRSDQSSKYPLSPTDMHDPGMNALGPKQGGFLGYKAIIDAMNPWDLVKGFARGMRWLFIGVKHRENDESYKAAHIPGSENDMSLEPTHMEDHSYKGTEGLPIANEFRRSKFGMPIQGGRADDEGAGLIAHAQPNPLNPGGSGYIPARQRYDSNGQDISSGGTRYESPNTSPDRLVGRNPTPGAVRRQENQQSDIGMAVSDSSPYQSQALQGPPYVPPQPQNYLDQKRQERRQAPRPSEQWANSSRPMRPDDAAPGVHNALWGTPQPRETRHDEQDRISRHLRQVHPDELSQYANNHSTSILSPIDANSAGTQSPQDPRRIGGVDRLTDNMLLMRTSAYTTEPDTENRRVSDPFSSNSAYMTTRSSTRNHEEEDLEVSDDEEQDEDTTMEDNEQLEDYSSILGGPEEHTSRLSSQLPFLQSEETSGISQAFEESGFKSFWRISPPDYSHIQSKLDSFSSALPAGFSLPLRNTLSRYLDGYFEGFHDHMPFIHIPTFKPVNCAPELLLALAAAGAQYRFERHRSDQLWYSAKAVAMEQLRRRCNPQAEISTPSTLRSGSLGASSPLSADGQGAAVQGSSVLDSSQDRLYSIQALFVLMAIGTWGPRGLLRDALSLRSHLSLLLGEEGSVKSCTSVENVIWETWIRLESKKRTKAIIYCFSNLHCVVYDMAPSILSSELQLLLPCSTKEWQANNAANWIETRRVSPPADVLFQDAFARLFANTDDSTPNPPISSFGNYVLINAIIQHIYFLRKSSLWGIPSTSNSGLKPEDIDTVHRALESWQQNSEGSIESGPMISNATALLRLATIRLNVDLKPCRQLDTRDPSKNSRAFKDFPFLKRSPDLLHAVAQSAHALSVPVRRGIAFVARTETYSWSIQNCLYNLECAFLLSKWLETMSSTNELTVDERGLLKIVKEIVDETDLAISFESKINEIQESRATKIRKLSVAIIRLWAQVFRGEHVFEIVGIMGASLEGFASLLAIG
ncbi:hypothetical protein B7494_g2051 [Chlorociboria aeruginascens]|nr:hypothetical protein B7494_g2051 [Chlorociboria aeruginascens]